ncbi:DUF4352 domain-containing protein [Micromonospora tulbaghiae]|uniref:DUF4352 domain-containing protein n=1 Tax=Micromonospora tulbaghiae TaxID=479978 RepID=UPI00332F000A
MHEQNNFGPQQPQQQPAYPPVTPVGSWPPPPPLVMEPAAPKKRYNGLVVGLVVSGVALLACCGGLSAIVGGESETQRVSGGGVVVTTTAAPTTAAPTTAAPTTAAPTTAAPTTAAPEPTEVAPEPEPSDDDVSGKPLGTTLIHTTLDGEVEITVTRSKKYPKARKSACDSYSPGPDEGYYLVLDVKVKVVSGTGSINPLYFKFVDNDGYEASTISGAFSGCGKSLGSGNNLRAGTKRAGQLVFDVASVKGEVVYSQPFRGLSGSWKVG